MLHGVTFRKIIFFIASGFRTSDPTEAMKVENYTRRTIVFQVR
jgi:hypothetical protein